MLPLVGCVHDRLFSPEFMLLVPSVPSELHIVLGRNYYILGLLPRVLVWVDGRYHVITSRIKRICYTVVYSLEFHWVLEDGLVKLLVDWAVVGDYDAVFISLEHLNLSFQSYLLAVALSSLYWHLHESVCLSALVVSLVLVVTAVVASCLLSVLGVVFNHL